MKNLKTKILFGAMFIMNIALNAQQDNAFINAMNKEIKRSMDSLKIDKMLPPNFISYSITDAHTIQIKAVLGGLVESTEKPFRTFENRVMVGENGINNENYYDENNYWSWNKFDNDIPFSGNTNDIRRALWLTTDDNYKKAVTNYEAKKSAMSQQSLNEEEKQLPDFCKATKTQTIVPYTAKTFDKNQLEQLAKKLSAVFINYPQIQSSSAIILCYDANVSFANSEGTTAQYPIQITGIKVLATTQSSMGEVLFDHALWFASDLSGLPDEKTMLAETEKIAKNLSQLSTTKPIDEPYCGPVLFEGEAAAEIVAQKFFTQTNGLIAYRKPIIGSEEIISLVGDKAKENTLEAMLNKKVISRDLTIESLPTLKEYNGIKLIGNFQVDAEGVKAPEKLVLVENGVLKNMLTDRVPTLKMKESNGHARAAISNAGIKSVTGPGVIKMTNNNPATTVDNAKLKEILLKAAKEEDLDYAYIVRKLVSEPSDLKEGSGVTFFGASKAKKDISKTIQVYRVKVADGSEELVSLAEVQGLSIKSFKHVLATSNQMQVYNTMVKPVNESVSSWLFNLTGIPASFIVPNGIVFQELDIVKEKQSVVKSKPIVPNPLSSK